MKTLDSVVDGMWPAGPAPKIVCADGFSLSVQARPGMYCTDAEGEEVEHGAEGFATPFATVEVGYPSARPEPWGEWSEYVADAARPTSTVYGFVPVETVRRLVDLHGGEA